MCRKHAFGTRVPSMHRRKDEKNYASTEGLKVSMRNSIERLRERYARDISLREINIHKSARWYTRVPVTYVHPLRVSRVTRRRPDTGVRFRIIPPEGARSGARRDWQYTYMYIYSPGS